MAGFKWQKKTKTTPHRDFVNDGEDVAEADRKTCEQKVNILEVMLGQIANICPVQYPETLLSVDDIWQTIHLHYGFQIKALGSKSLFYSQVSDYRAIMTLLLFPAVWRVRV
jgi:hypothetical protein